MNEKLRKIHLYSALSLLGFMLIYFLSGFLVLNRGLFPASEPQISTKIVQVQAPASLDAGQTGRWLAEELELGGQLQAPQVQDDGRVRYRYFRPGLVLEALLSADRGSVEITRTEYSIIETASGFHSVHSYGSGFIRDLWALLLDLASLGCIVFAISGVCIWATSAERDKVSWVMLPAGLVITIGTVLYVMLTK